MLTSGANVSDQYGHQYVNFSTIFKNTMKVSNRVSC
jgi:hypothetical protein